MPRGAAGGSTNTTGLRDIPLRPDATRTRSVALDKIAANPRNLREHELWGSDEERDETVTSMQTLGLIHALVVCTRDAFLEFYPDFTDQLGEVQYIVMAGHRRLDAARRAGLTEIRIDVQNEKLPQLDLLMLEENLKRRSLNVFQEGEGYRRLLAQGSSHSQVAKMVGKSKSTITKRVALLDLVGEARRAVLEGSIGVDAAYNLIVALDGDLTRFMEAATVMKQQRLIAVDAVNRVLAGSARTDTGLAAAETRSGSASSNAADEQPVLAEPAQAGTATATATQATGVPSARSEPVLAEPADGQDGPGSTEPQDPPARQTAKGTTPAVQAEQAGRAQANAARNEHCQQLVTDHEKPTTDPQGTRIATAALVHATSAALNRAHAWMKNARAADADALSPASYRDAVLVRADATLIARLAYAVALAEDELRASNRSRHWDYRDVAHLRHLIDTGYEPTEWERRHLG